MHNDKRDGAETLFNGFLSRHLTGEIRDYRNIAIEDSDLYRDISHFRPELTHFDDLYDTLLYSRIITAGLTKIEEAGLIIDLGAGSSLPTLLALTRSGRRDFNVEAFDIDPEAATIGKRNAERFGLSEHYRFHRETIGNVLRGDWARKPNVLLVSNPPFIPTPPALTDQRLIPINGGPGGEEILLQILEQDYRPGTVLALLWGSLTEPFRVIPLIETSYEVLTLKAARTGFGKYTTMPAMRAHLQFLKEQDRVVFEEDSQIVIGAVLRKR